VRGSAAAGAGGGGGGGGWFPVRCLGCCEPVRRLLRLAGNVVRHHTLLSQAQDGKMDRSVAYSVTPAMQEPVWKKK
jgi:hypothetical protein